MRMGEYSYGEDIDQGSQSSIKEQKVEDLEQGSPQSA